MSTPIPVSMPPRETPETPATPDVPATPETPTRTVPQEIPQTVPQEVPDQTQIEIPDDVPGTVPEILPFRPQGQLQAVPAAGTSESARQFNSFAEFYPFYLEQHQDRTCRRLHFVGSTLGLVGLGAALVTGRKRYLAAGIVAGYGCAWVGHFFFEKNRPATFSHPLYSFMGDWVMYKDMLTGKIEI